MCLDEKLQYKFRQCLISIARHAASFAITISVAACTLNTQGSAPSASTNADRSSNLQYERILATNAVANLMGRYSFYSLANTYDKTWTDLFANGDPNLRIEIASRGIWEGGDAAQRLVQHYQAQKDDAPKEMGKDWIGVMSLHTMDTSVIEVAGDGKTARGVWMSPGIETTPVNASWTWVKYCADFKKTTDGQWKIWNFLVTIMFRAEYDKPWLDALPKPRPPVASDPNAPVRGTFRSLPFQSDRPSDIDPPTLFTPSLVQRLEPTSPPSPYQTWDDSMACVKKK